MLKIKDKFERNFYVSSFLKNSFSSRFPHFPRKEEENFFGEKPSSESTASLSVQCYSKIYLQFLRFFLFSFKSGLCNVSINYQCLVVLLFVGDIEGGQEVKDKIMQKGDMKKLWSKRETEAKKGLRDDEK